MRPRFSLPVRDAAVRVAAHLADEQPARLVEGHRDRIDHVRLARDQLDLEAGQRLEGGQLFLGGERVGGANGGTGEDTIGRRGPIGDSLCLWCIDSLC